MQKFQGHQWHFVLTFCSTDLPLPTKTKTDPRLLTQHSLNTPKNVSNLPPPPARPQKVEMTKVWGGWGIRSAACWPGVKGYYWMEAVHQFHNRRRLQINAARATTSPTESLMPVYCIVAAVGLHPRLECPDEHVRMPYGPPFK